MHTLKRILIVLLFIIVAGAAAGSRADTPPICIDAKTAQINVVFKGDIQVIKRYKEFDPAPIRQARDFISNDEFQSYKTEKRFKEARGENYYSYEVLNFDSPVRHNQFIEDGSNLEDVYIIRDDQGKLKLLGEAHEYGMIQCLNRLRSGLRISAPPR